MSIYQCSFLFWLKVNFLHPSLMQFEVRNIENKVSVPAGGFEASVVQRVSDWHISGERE